MPSASSTRASVCSRSSGTQAGVSLVKEGKAVLYAMTGDFEAARELQQEVIAHRRAVGGLFGISDNLGLMLMIEAGSATSPRHAHCSKRCATCSAGSAIAPGSPAASRFAPWWPVARVTTRPRPSAWVRSQGMRDRSLNMLVPSEMLGFYEPSKEPLERLLPERYAALFELGRSMDPEEVFLTDGLAADLA